MTRTRVLAALLAGLTLAGLGTAAAGSVTAVAQTRTTSPTSSPAPAPAGAVAVATGLTADEAVSRAVAHLGGGTATKVERETEHGRVVWKVDVRRDSGITEVHVDTATGGVTRVDDADRSGRGRDDRAGDDRAGDDRAGDDRGGDDRGGDDRSRHGGDDGPGHH